MRTTVDIPDELMKKAKIKAVEEGITFKELVIQSLHDKLDSSNKELEEKPWKALKGTIKGASDLKPEDSGFDPDWEPEEEFELQVNDPGQGAK